MRGPILTQRSLRMASQRPDPPGAADARRKENAAREQALRETKGKFGPWAAMTDAQLEEADAWREARIAELMR